MRSMRWSLTGVVLVLVSCGGGSSSSNNESSPSPTETGVEVAYKVGDTGPGGGIIVYVDKAGFDNSSGGDTSIGAMCLTGTCHYLEMAPTDLDTQYSRDDAMVVAKAFSTPSANDWVLPSRDALNEMCKYAFGDTDNRNCNDIGNGSLSPGFGGLSTDNYWSSSEYDDDEGWAQDLNFGFQYSNDKGDPFYGRPVRAF